MEHEIDCLAGAGDGGLDSKEETQETPTKREELQTFCQDSVSYNKIDFVGREGDALSKL